MKIQVLDAESKTPLTNTRLQLQIKGKDSGFLSSTTDDSGFLQIDDKFEGQQLIASFGNKQSTPATVKDGAKLLVATAKEKETTLK